MRFPQTCIIIPCFNEENRLGKYAVSSFAKKNPEFHLILIDDCSTDNTLNLLNAIANDALYRNITVLRNSYNAGKAETIRVGILHLSVIGSFEYVGFWDADLSTQLDEVFWFFHFIHLFNDKKIFFGSRSLKLGSLITRKLYRHILGRIFATAVSRTLDLPVYDTQCGAKIFSMDTALELFEKPFITRWLFDVELLFRYKIINGKDKTLSDVYEVPLQRWEHKEGSKLKLIDFIKAPLQLYKIKNAYKQI